ncbi:MAG: replicative DNA helicase [Fimbriimonadia bacterium]|nr:replicative DNA helicase [Fimbriimonadia bacterium]
MSSSQIGRVPPHSLEAEMSALGAMMLDRNAIERVGELLKPDDFYRESHRLLFEVMLSLNERHVPVDLLTLREELARRDDLERAGGLAYLAQLVESVPTAANAEYYARIVEEKAILRRLMQASHEILKLVDEPEETVEDVVDRAEQMIFNVAQRRIGNYFTPVDQLLLSVLDRIEEMQQSGRSVLGTATHFRDMDRITSGLQKAELIILAARPSMGKTALALSIGENVALRGQETVAVFSLEMSQESLVQRMICSQAGVSAQRMRLGMLKQNDWERLQSACERLFKAPIYIDDTSDVSVMEIRGKCRRLRAEKGLGLIIIDYLQLMRSSSRRNENRNQEIAEIARALKSLAREFEVPVVALSQLSRAVERRDDKRPVLSDLRESGSIEAEADLVMFIHRPAYYNKELYEDYHEENQPVGVDKTEIAEIIVAKQRNGPTGTIQLGFQPEYTRFVTIERHVE